MWDIYKRDIIVIMPKDNRDRELKGVHGRKQSAVRAKIDHYDNGSWRWSFWTKTEC